MTAAMKSRALSRFDLKEKQFGRKRRIQTGHELLITDAVYLIAQSFPPMVYPNPMPDAIIAEDEAIAAHPLGIDAAAIERWPVADLFA